MSIVCIHNDCEGFLTKPQGFWLCDWHRNNEAPPRYTKDLEDMLGRMIPICGVNRLNSWAQVEALVAEAKALLERTDPERN